MCLVLRDRNYGCGIESFGIVWYDGGGLGWRQASCRVASCRTDKAAEEIQVPGSRRAEGTRREREGLDDESLFDGKVRVGYRARQGGRERVRGYESEVRVWDLGIRTEVSRVGVRWQKKTKQAHCAAAAKDDWTGDGESELWWVPMAA